jgi:hypothetical protein
MGYEGQGLSRALCQGSNRGHRLLRCRKIIRVSEPCCQVYVGQAVAESRCLLDIFQPAKTVLAGPVIENVDAVQARAEMRSGASAVHGDLSVPIVENHSRWHACQHSCYQLFSEKKTTLIAFPAARALEHLSRIVIHHEHSNLAQDL